MPKEILRSVGQWRKTSKMLASSSSRMEALHGESGRPSSGLQMTMRKSERRRLEGETDGHFGQAGLPMRIQTARWQMPLLTGKLQRRAPSPQSAASCHESKLVSSSVLIASAWLLENFRQLRIRRKKAVATTNHDSNIHAVALWYSVSLWERSASSTCGSTAALSDRHAMPETLANTLAELRPHAGSLDHLVF